MEQHYVDALKNDNHKLTKELYDSYRNEFFAFAKRYQIAQDDISDIYQEAFLAIRRHALSRKLYEVNSSFKTYLFGIGKHFIYKKLKDYASKKNYDATLHKQEDDYEEIIIDQGEILTEEQELLRRYFKELGKSCQRMLTLSFYRGLTNEEIAKLEGYENEAVVRSQKSRCLKTLKNHIKSSNPQDYEH